MEFFPPLDDDTDEQTSYTETFSEEFACTECGISFDDITPQCFSFNNPVGMRTKCDGRGTALAAASELIDRDERRRIMNGAVVPWGNDGWMHLVVTLLKSLVAHGGHM